MNNLVSQVLEPTIGNYFRNSAQDSDVIAFLTLVKKDKNLQKSYLSSFRRNVYAVDTLIGDTPPESLMKTLTDQDCTRTKLPEKAFKTDS
jgi:hypothetical protein